jgi:hypothetical protein
MQWPSRRPPAAGEHDPSVAYRLWCRPYTSVTTLVASELHQGRDRAPLSHTWPARSVPEWPACSKLDAVQHPPEVALYAARGHAMGAGLPHVHRIVLPPSLSTAQSSSSTVNGRSQHEARLYHMCRDHFGADGSTGLNVRPDRYASMNRPRVHLLLVGLRAQSHSNLRHR